MEASTAEAEAISAALAAAEAKSRHQNNGEFEPHSPDRDRGAEATPSGKPPSSPSSAAIPVQTPPTGVRLHHRAVCISSLNQFLVIAVGSCKLCGPQSTEKLVSF